jgi:hypothetical protein
VKAAHPHYDLALAYVRDTNGELVLDGERTPSLDVDRLPPDVQRTLKTTALRTRSAQSHSAARAYAAQMATSASSEAMSARTTGRAVSAHTPEEKQPAEAQDPQSVVAGVTENATEPAKENAAAACQGQPNDSGCALGDATNRKGVGRSATAHADTATMPAVGTAVRVLYLTMEEEDWELGTVTTVFPARGTFRVTYPPLPCVFSSSWVEHADEVPVCEHGALWRRARHDELPDAACEPPKAVEGHGRAAQAPVPGSKPTAGAFEVVAPAQNTTVIGKAEVAERQTRATADEVTGRQTRAAAAAASLAAAPPASRTRERRQEELSVVPPCTAQRKKHPTKEALKAPREEGEGAFTHFYYDRRGKFYARFACDTAGKYHECTPQQIDHDTRKQLAEAKQHPNKKYKVDGGAWSGVVGAQPGLAHAPASPVCAVLPLVPFQRKADYCVFGSVLNAKSLTDKQRKVVQQNMTRRSDIAQLRNALGELGCGVQLLKTHAWYALFKGDQNLHQLLSWILRGEATGELVVNVEETDGSIGHYLLFDCDEKLVYDVNPRFGRYAHPLNEAIIKRMRIRGIVAAAKIDNTRIPKKML